MRNKNNNVLIAVIGMACRYPGASDLIQFWENILAKRRQFRPFPDKRLPLSDYFNPDPSAPDKTYCNKAALIDGFQFDWAGHRVPKSTYESTDIVHWLALDVALQSLRDAGFNSQHMRTEKSGVILGNTLTGEHTRAEGMRLRWPFVKRTLNNAARAKRLPEEALYALEETMEHYYKSVFAPVTEDTLSGGLSNTIAGRICNYLDFHGGGYTVDGACSSSLIAVATAATALSNGDMDLALAGGVDISLDTFEMIGFAKTGALTKKDMHVYDQKASGFIPGEGCGFVVLKRLEDAKADGNFIYAVINGWGISSDGKGGLTAPSVSGQARALKRAYEKARYSPADLDFIEGHGTGTVVGDKTELEAISAAMGSFNNGTQRSCGITSLKSIIGHAKAASGIGGFIKAVMATNRRVIPLTANCSEPNEVFNHSVLSVYPVLAGKVHNAEKKLKAGISAMGFGGINCHVTIESGDGPSDRIMPDIDERKLMLSHQDTELFVFSSQSIQGLLNRLKEVKQRVQNISEGELVDIAAMLSQECNPNDQVRASLIAGSPLDLGNYLDHLEEVLRKDTPASGDIYKNALNNVFIGNMVSRHKVGFLFPGQGSQFLNMGRVLVERHFWAQEILAIAPSCLLKGINKNIEQYIFRSIEKAVNNAQVNQWSNLLKQTEIAQPAICLTSILWMNKLKKLGIRPEAVGGHSLGELSAFHAAGAFDESELLKLASVRGHAMASNGNENGIMASLACSHETALEILNNVNGNTVIANINSPEQVVISGERSSVERIVSFAENKNIKTRILPVSNAFHSQFVSTAAEHLRKNAPVPKILGETTVNIISSMSGAVVKPGLDLHGHFADQVLSQVDFVSLVNSMSGECDLLVEIGPGRVLSNLANNILIDRDLSCLPVESRAGRDSDLNAFLGTYYIHGGDINWEELYQDRLVRTFVPAAERIFIDNPCERPYGPELDIPDYEVTEYASLKDNPFTANAPKGLFSREQVDYIRRLIRYETSRDDSAYEDSGYRSDARDRESENLPLTEERDLHTALQIHDAVKPDHLLSLAADTTGFPLSSLSLDNRLLDDLNLDSIKAGQFAAQALKLYNVSGKLDPTTFANSSLLELFNKIEGVILVSPTAMSGSTVDKLPQIEEVTPEVLLELTAKETGFPLESLSLNNRLLDNLNLDSIKAGQLVGMAIKTYGADRTIDPTSMANASLQEIFDSILRSVPDSSKKDSFSLQNEDRQVESPPHHSWVRTFNVKYQIEELQGLSYQEIIDAEAAAGEKSVVIVADHLSGEYINSFRSVLSANGIDARHVTYQDIYKSKPDKDLNILSIIFIMPKQDAPEFLDYQSIREMAERLYCIGKVISLAKKYYPDTSYAVVQHGGEEVFNQSDDLSIVSKGCAAFMASVHLENMQQKIRVLEFHKSCDPKAVVKRSIAEVSTAAAFSIAGYDADFSRSIPMLTVAEPGLWKDRGIEWSSNDVVLVTGGGKGITAACALAFARKTGVKLALAGRTALIDKDKEIQQNLQQYRDGNVRYRYYACDISDGQCVLDLKERVEKDLGPITGVIHGAAVNKARRVDQISLQDMLHEISPKLRGAINICSALKDSPPKIFIGFSSIIGVTGMMGSACYAFANEVMNLLLQRYSSITGKTQVISLAFSVWDEIGMGVKMGSIKTLGSKGILPIVPEEGISRFMQLSMNDPGEHQMVITSRLTGIDTFNTHPVPSHEQARFIEEVLNYEKGVEIEAKAGLTLERDPYLKDHLFRDTFLFPTVFGIEAMAQAASIVSGVNKIENVSLKNINLSYPITVAPDDTTEILIHATVDDTAQDLGVISVRAGIKVDQTGFSKDHFEATFVFSNNVVKEKTSFVIPDNTLNIIPEEDLYGHMLFQGKMFQKIQSVRLIDQSSCVFEASKTLQLHKLIPHIPKLFCGDPFCRDTLLQSVQIIVPDLTALPVEIEQWDIYSSESSEDELYTMSASLTERTSDTLLVDVTALDKKGKIVEQLRGYKAKILNIEESGPQALDLVNPDKWDTMQINKVMNNYSREMHVVSPVVALRHQNGFHSIDKEVRRQIEADLLNSAYRDVHDSTQDLPELITVTWNNDGKPFINETDKVGISFSHDNRLCMCTVGFNEQGCDIEPIIHQSESKWTDLLGSSRRNLLKEVYQKDHSYDIAGSRIWCALEALRKAYGMAEDLLKIDSMYKDCLLFSSGNALILTFRILLLRGSERMCAFTVTKSKTVKSSASISLINKLDESSWGEFVPAGPEGQSVFSHSFPLSLRDSSTVNGGIYFASYFHWLGKVRELTIKPIGRIISEEFHKGHFMVTNYSETLISGDVRNHENIHARVWIDRIYGIKNSSMDLHFEWQRITDNKSAVTVAFSKQQVSWSRVKGHGIVEPAPCPEFFMDYLLQRGFIPKDNGTGNNRGAIAQNILPAHNLGVLIRQFDRLENNNILQKGLYSTSMAHSNVAQNIYFSNYFTWQGEIRDRYLFSVSPGHYRAMNNSGQFVCLKSDVKHLREAMPFDDILVTMKLTGLYEKGLELYFEYFRADQKDYHVKLAYGTHTLAWAKVDQQRNFTPELLPEIYVRAFDR